MKYRMYLQFLMLQFHLFPKYPMLQYHLYRWIRMFQSFLLFLKYQKSLMIPLLPIVLLCLV
jgi:hypothetical protein